MALLVVPLYQAWLLNQPKKQKGKKGEGKGEDEEGVRSSLVYKSTREVAVCLYALGVKHIIVVVSKLDDEYMRHLRTQNNHGGASVEEGEGRQGEVQWHSFERVTNVMRDMLAQIGYKGESVDYVGVSAETGEGIKEYKDWPLFKREQGSFLFISLIYCNVVTFVL